MRFPFSVPMKSHDFPPPFPTTNHRFPPSPYRPGLVSFFTLNALSAIFHNPFHTRTRDA